MPRTSKNPNLAIILILMGLVLVLHHLVQLIKRTPLLTVSIAIQKIAMKN